MSLRPRALPAGFIAPCLPTSAPQPPSADLWLHEIKHDSFRVIARKEGKRVRLCSRPGNDLTGRFRRSSPSSSIRSKAYAGLGVARFFSCIRGQANC
jgi:ATP-dependent DNA ligase